MFVITARNHSTGQSHLIIMKKEDPGCSLRQRACFCLLQQPAEPVRWRRWPRSRDLPRHLTIDTSLVFVQVDPGEKSAVSTNLLFYIGDFLKKIGCNSSFISLLKMGRDSKEEPCTTWSNQAGSFMATGEILAWEEMVGGTKAAPLDTSRTELPKVNRHLLDIGADLRRPVGWKSCSTIFVGPIGYRPIPGIFKFSSGKRLLYYTFSESSWHQLTFFLFSNFRKGRLLYIHPVGRLTSPLIFSIYTGIKALY